MPNKNGNAYALTTLCPIKNGGLGNLGFATMVRDRLEDLPLHEDSPLARVPNTYLCRFYVLNDVFYEGEPAALDHLKSAYLVFTSNFYGALEPYLEGMWEHARETVEHVWEYCVAFDRVRDAATFIDYIKRCQVYTTFFFNGSTDDSLAEQLKSLYLKQEFSKFAFEHQGLGGAELQQAFRDFVARTRPADLAGPTWRPGASTLDVAVVNETPPGKQP